MERLHKEGKMSKGYFGNRDPNFEQIIKEKLQSDIVKLKRK